MWFRYDFNVGSPSLCAMITQCEVGINSSDTYSCFRVTTTRVSLMLAPPQVLHLRSRVNHVLLYYNNDIFCWAAVKFLSV